MILIIGSVALRHHIFSIDPPKDVDLVGTYDDIRNYAKENKASYFYPINNGKSMKFMINGKIHEAEIAYPGSSAEELLKLVENYDFRVSKGLTIPSLNVLYMLKMSHRFLRNSPHFLKTRNDIDKMREHGAYIERNQEEFYHRRQLATYDYPHPVLEASKNDFFSGDGVTYTYDHDAIHEAVKLSDRPAYMSFKPDDRPVMVCKKMWDDCDWSVKINSCIEESMVLAIERSLVPFPSVLTPSQAFDMALMKCCTSISSVGWREFCWENYHEIRNKMDIKFYDYFLEKVKSCEIVKINP